MHRQRRRLLRGESRQRARGRREKIRLRPDILVHRQWSVAWFYWLSAAAPNGCAPPPRTRPSPPERSSGSRREQLKRCAARCFAVRRSAPSPCRTPSSCPTSTGPRSSSAAGEPKKSQEELREQGSSPFGVIADQEGADQHLVEGRIEPQKADSASCAAQTQKTKATASLCHSALTHMCSPRTAPLNALGNGCLQRRPLQTHRAGSSNVVARTPPRGHPESAFVAGGCASLIVFSCLGGPGSTLFGVWGSSVFTVVVQ